jgi:hypothetical protein
VADPGAAALVRQVRADGRLGRCRRRGVDVQDVDAVLADAALDEDCVDPESRAPAEDVIASVGDGDGAGRRNDRVTLLGRIVQLGVVPVLAAAELDFEVAAGVVAGEGRVLIGLIDDWLNWVRRQHRAGRKGGDGEHRDGRQPGELSEGATAATRE